MSARLLNPYQNPSGQWWRGNFHGHTAEHSPCATVPLAAAIGKYRGVGARFMAVTDHDHVSDLSAVRLLFPDMVLLEGFEYSSCENVLFVGDKVPDLFDWPLNEAIAAATALLTIVAHPEPQPGSGYWTYEKVMFLDLLPDGVEIYNGHYGTPAMRALGNQPQYTQFWDELLTAGHRVWGFANDDSHEPPDFDNAFNMVLVDEPTPAGVVAAAKRGRCYGSTGLLLKDLTVNGGQIRVTVSGSATGRFVGPGGRVLATAKGTAFSFSSRGEAYVRFEAEGRQGMLFLQPMFRAV